MTRPMDVVSLQLSFGDGPSKRVVATMKLTKKEVTPKNGLPVKKWTMLYSEIYSTPHAAETFRLVRELRRTLCMESSDFWGPYGGKAPADYSGKIGCD